MWWRDGVIYQVYVRSFADADGDGHGDLAGLRSKLEYLEWLGVDAVWLTPINPSPNEDWGYDVSDYLDVHPDYGTRADVDALISDAKAHGIQVVLDLVPNHTSDRHPWFQDPAKRDWYVWADKPNNWRSTFGGPAWTYHDEVGRYYLHNFLPEQPDLDWWNEDVRDEFDRILRFWFDRGVAGFRIDVAHALVKDKHLRDNPRRTSGDIRKERVYNMNQPEVHDVYKRWRKLADSYDPPRILVGETWVSDPDDLARYYGTDDQLHLAMNFPFTMAPLRATALRGVVERAERAYPPDAWPVWTGSNHDIVRFPTRWCAGDEAKIRCALLILLALRGTPILYYGDELGMEQVAIPPDEQLDRAHKRDGARTPMPWTRNPDRQWWLRYGDATRNVEDMRDDPTSTLSFTRALLALRRSSPELQRGAYSTIGAGPGVWAWRRGEGATVAVNLSDRSRIVRRVEGSIRASTAVGREGENVSGGLRLAAWEGAVVLTG
jgi:alpha-glucosidase